MAQKTIVAERIYSEKKNAEVWQVAVQVPSGKRYGRRDIEDPLKAMRYMFLLRKKEYAEISEECIAKLQEVRKSAKTVEA